MRRRADTLPNTHPEPLGDQRRLLKRRYVRFDLGAPSTGSLKSPDVSGQPNAKRCIEAGLIACEADDYRPEFVSEPPTRLPERLERGITGYPNDSLRQLAIYPP